MAIFVLAGIVVGQVAFLSTPGSSQSISPCGSFDSEPATLLANAIVDYGLQNVSISDSAIQIVSQVNQTIGLVNDNLKLNFAGMSTIQNGAEKVAAILTVIRAYNNLITDAHKYNQNDPNSVCQIYEDAFILGATVGIFDASTAGAVMTVIYFQSNMGQIRQMANYCNPCDCIQTVINAADNTAANFLSSDYSAAWTVVKESLIGLCHFATASGPSVPEFPEQPLLLAGLTSAVLAAYLLVRNHSRAGSRRTNGPTGGAMTLCTVRDSDPFGAFPG